MEKVASAARASWPGEVAVFRDEVAVVIVYFHYGESLIDVDNIIKPILDALIGVTFSDDRVVAQVLCRRTMATTGLVIEQPSECLAAGLDLGVDFVYVAIDRGLDHRTVP